jgi:phage baseplate assembly protein W
VPAERISKGFKDISAIFEVNPLNDDLIALKNSNAIARSIRNLIFTVPGDKPFNPFLGCRVSEMLFDPMDKITTSAIRTEIEETVNNYEPRVNLKKVQVQENPDGNEYNVIINYTIIGVDADTQQLSFALELTR